MTALILYPRLQNTVDARDSKPCQQRQSARSSLVKTINLDGCVIVGDVEEAVRRVSRTNTNLTTPTRSHVREIPCRRLSVFRQNFSNLPDLACTSVPTDRPITYG
jgi:hypothetical protein